MYVSSVSLKNFRNLNQLNMELTDGINILYGMNAQGKTNFLESVYLCAVGRSHRTLKDKEMIAFSEKESFVNISVKEDDTEDKISVYLRKDERKGIAVNRMPLKKIGELFGILLTVIFSPEDLQLVKNGPSERRKFLDMELCQLSRVYYYELQNYHRVLKQRNNLLKETARNKSLKDTFFIWDEQLVSHGNKLYSHRKDFAEKLNCLSAKIYSEITNNKEKLEILYKPNVNPENFMQRLQKGLEKDIYTGSTSQGLHKDDLSFLIDGVDVRNFGSQGQQRTASLSAKLAEIELIYNEKGRTPVLLLDDVLSELDSSRQFYLLSRLKNIQTIITCTGVEDVLKSVGHFPNIRVFNVCDGNINPQNTF